MLLIRFPLRARSASGFSFSTGGSIVITSMLLMCLPRCVCVVTKHGSLFYSRQSLPGDERISVASIRCIGIALGFEAGSCKVRGPLLVITMLMCLRRFGSLNQYAPALSMLVGPAFTGLLSYCRCYLISIHIFFFLNRRADEVCWSARRLHIGIRLLLCCNGSIFC